MQYVTPADGIAGDRGDNGFGDVANEVLQVEDVQTRDMVLTDVASVTANLLIAARAKRLIPSTGEDHNTDVQIFTRVGKGVDHLIDGSRSKGVANLGPI